MKTERVEIPRRDVRIAADDATPFENGQIRIERAECSPCAALGAPAVVITMDDRQVHWVIDEAPAGRQIRIALKTRPDKPAAH